MRRVLVYGGNGALGRAVVSRLHRDQFLTVSADYAPSPADVSIVLNPQHSAAESAKQISGRLSEEFGSQRCLHGIVHVAGGWLPGTVGSENFLENCDQMWKMNTQSALCAAHLSALHLNDRGVCVMTGAKVADAACPDMLAYAMSKSAVHYVVKSLAHAQLQEGFKVSAILP